jgi:hypothetical protein
MTGRSRCPQAKRLGISARAADGDIRAALEEVVNHQVQRGGIPPERRDHAVGWCFTWLAEQDSARLRRFCVHVQAIGAVAVYPEVIPSGEVADV